MALALGAVLLMPFIGYTSHQEFTNYTKIDGQWHVYLPITETFNPDFTDYGRTIIQGDSSKLGETEIYRNEIFSLSALRPLKNLMLFFACRI